MSTREQMKPRSNRNRRRLLSATALLVAAVVGCATGQRAGSEEASERPVAEPGTMGEASSSDASDRSDQLRAALDRALSSPGPWPTLHVASECQSEEAPGAVEIFGTGVAIWNSSVQFELSPEHLRAVLEAFRRADFPSLKAVYGRRSEPRKPSSPGTAPGANATMMICRVALALEGLTKEVTQLAKGEYSPTLEALANEIFAIVEEPAKQGIRATGLRDGLEKIAAGDLAPETLRLLLHRKAAGRGAAEGGGGFLLRVEGTRASSRAYGPDDLGPRVLSLADADLALLAEDIALIDPAGLPANLWAPDYTDFAVSVLDHKKSVQARKFAGMTRTTHGQRQVDFDRIYGLLDELHKRVLREGEAVPASGGR